ncbi:hypothetical protein J5H43_01710 [Stenotrophomonas maltophilia]|uniref:hypothetical protein n=1 Tax=Stenotrophomonas maltophilia TaxID=40324 RepID=UPI001AAFDA6C|nr:hypothetical protein [Stenotrophomonas maltophilia]MBO3002229.1 hypothetical protein [Stenotrophomonas maltophilia]MBP1381627.1 hypothetical protein [Stenotrophomonas maltophilia]MBP1386639.1 hypothetical protein [Stenotrophomonas maltophilia]
MADFFDSYSRGFALGQQQKQDRQNRNMLAELQQIGPQVIAGDLAATDRAYALDPQRAQAFQAEGNRQQQQLFGLAKSLKQAAANPQMQAGIYRSAVPFLKRSFGAEIPDEFDAASVMPIVDQVLAVAENAPSMGVGGNVQSTYIDGNGNRVAILRDGSQRVLGPNNASIRVMEQEGALPYGVVTSGGRPGAVVDIGSGQAPMQGATGQYTIDPSLPPEVQQQIRAAEAAGQQVPSNMVLPPRSGPVRVPTAAEKAGASEVARLEAQQRYLPDELAMRTQAAIQQAGGSAQAKGEAEARLEAIQGLPRVMQESTNAINLIDKALSHPGLATAVGASGRTDPRNYIPGTDATDFRVLLDQIKGGTFLQAFQSLKGGGAITEVEGTKAEQAIARLNRDQSEAAFRQSLQDLRDVAQAAITRAKTKAQAAGGGQAPMAPQGAPRQIQSAAEYNALPSGALFIAPDGTQRRKR